MCVNIVSVHALRLVFQAVTRALVSYLTRNNYCLWNCNVLVVFKCVYCAIITMICFCLPYYSVCLFVFLKCSISYHWMCILLDCRGKAIDTAVCTDFYLYLLCSWLVSLATIFSFYLTVLDKKGFQSQKLMPLISKGSLLEKWREKSEGEVANPGDPINGR